VNVIGHEDIRNLQIQIQDVEVSTMHFAAVFVEEYFAPMQRARGV
jgi:hypothetical protein